MGGYGGTAGDEDRRSSMVVMERRQKDLGGERRSSAATVRGLQRWGSSARREELGGDGVSVLPFCSAWARIQ
jgi:hypothetical protein